MNSTDGVWTDGASPDGASPDGVSTDGVKPAVRLAQILAELIASDGEPSIVTRLCRLCATATEASVGLSLATRSDGAWTAVAATDRLARRAEELQSLVGEGPRPDAARHRRPVLQSDLLNAAADRWPTFVSEAHAAGVRAAFVFPLQIGAIMMGTLGLYRTVPGALTAAQLSDALTFTDAATLVLLQLQDGSSSGEVHRALAEPLAGNAEVHQATGMVSVQLDVDLSEALLRLRARAYSDGRPIKELAADVVARRVRLDHSDNGQTITTENTP